MRGFTPLHRGEENGYAGECQGVGPAQGPNGRQGRHETSKNSVAQVDRDEYKARSGRGISHSFPQRAGVYGACVRGC